MFHGETQKKTRKVKTIISYKRTVGGITIPISKLYYRIIATKQHGISTIELTSDQWNQITVPDMNLQSYGHLYFDKQARNTH